jgi:hypothetical protein
MAGFDGSSFACLISPIRLPTPRKAVSWRDEGATLASPRSAREQAVQAIVSGTASRLQREPIIAMARWIQLWQTDFTYTTGLAVWPCGNPQGQMLKDD